ncbi:MAG: LppX_LprAFG lipoprotein [Ardenticatenaceae bacterium]
MKRTLVLNLLTLILMILASCGGPAAEPTPTPVPPTPTPSPQDWLERGVEAWNNTESFHFTLELVERTIALDESGVLSFDQAEGDVVAPDSLQAQASVSTPFGRTEVGYVAIGEQQWLTNPLNGQWEEAPPEMRTDVATLFDPEAGIGPLLAEMENLERLPDETLEETSTVHLRGTLPGAVLANFADDLPETVNVDLWIGADDHRIRQLVITEPASEGASPTWTFLFSEFNAAPAIEPPV